jgi:hypothetical protein
MDAGVSQHVFGSTTPPSVSAADEQESHGWSSLTDEAQLSGRRRRRPAWALIVRIKREEGPPPAGPAERCRAAPGLATGATD